MFQKSSSMLCFITTVLMWRISERAHKISCFSVEIRAGMFGVVLEGPCLLPDRPADLKTLLPDLLEDGPSVMRCAEVVSMRHAQTAWIRRVDYMASSVTRSNSVDSSCLEKLRSTSKQSTAVCLDMVSGRFEHLS
jgi:hypothetical protein